ncbi:MAG: UDP-N-acetylmuramate dehydrogenase [Bdellovibrionaceae bacterium]|nr:UDP-N-acetylmuramate dehydrogenase [Pseudobdellovibrionaceae bacterium]
MTSLIQNDVELKRFTTWKVGGVADHFASPANLDEVKESIAWAKNQKLPITILGQGSNVLVSDKGVRGLVLSTRRLQELQILSEDQALRVQCQTGVLKYKLMRLFLKYNLDPALFLSGIPGDIGGGVVMNAGVGESIQPREFCEIIESVQVLKWKTEGETCNFDLVTYKQDELQWSYRHSHGWQPGFVFSAIVSWPMHPNPDIAAIVKQAIDLRRLKQPLDKPSCGSVFVNPEGHKSGALIESCGLKGFSVGGAQVSNKHANFIVNTGQATASDIHQVISHVQSKVFEKYNVKLHTEVVYMGEWSH